MSERPAITQHSATTIEQKALVDVARAHLAQFAASHGSHVCALARDTEGALHEAIAAGISLHRLAAELDLSPHALTAILDGNPGLLELHPSRAH